ncbi:dihydrofolate reductase family protein [Streptomyces niveus]|uniref:dihydrofolate reductase family protein n=1 Tax=Streptomyces niveus TaxID=193462 RepID=UPI003626F767
MVRGDRLGRHETAHVRLRGGILGGQPPFHTPVFVLTNRPAPTLVKEGGTSFTFVADGIHSALDQAKAAAGDRNVDIAGGADTVQQYLRARLVDDLQLHVLPIRVVDTPGATHLKYRVLK